MKTFKAKWGSWEPGEFNYPNHEEVVDEKFFLSETGYEHIDVLSIKRLDVNQTYSVSGGNHTVTRLS